MSLGRLVSILSVSAVAAGIATAAPKKTKPTKPVAPATGSATGSAGAKPTGGGGGSASGSAAGGGDGSGSSAGSAVQMTEDAPPKDMNGIDENPDAPHAMTNIEHVDAAPVAQRPTGYPVEEALRPITLPQNMSEVWIAPHATVDYVPIKGAPGGYSGADALHARYGITSKVQLGVAYLFGAVYHDPSTDKLGFHSGKALDVDVTVLLQNWIGVRVGVPIYINPFAIAIALGAPLKFTFGDKFAIGGLDDLLTITLSKFPPSLTSELVNAYAASQINVGKEPQGDLRFSAYGIYQPRPNVALIGRLGIDLYDFASQFYGPATTFIRAGVDYTPRHYLDLGISLGFDDLGHFGSFGPAGYLAFRI